MSSIPILIVENNASHLKLEKLALAEHNFDIHSATNADETMKILKKIHPKLILMAIELPGIDGLELTKKLKADPMYRDITIVAITAYGMEGDKKTMLDAGCDGYIPKPIDVDAFPQTISSYITR